MVTPGRGLGLGGWVRVGQTFRYGVGVGVQGMAIEKRVKNRCDQDELDGDGQRDLSGERLLQEVRHGFAHGCSLIRNGHASFRPHAGHLLSRDFKRIDHQLGKRGERLMTNMAN
jgi:hypothetical protein